MIKQRMISKIGNIFFVSIIFLFCSIIIYPNYSTAQEDATKVEANSEKNDVPEQRKEKKKETDINRQENNSLIKKEAKDWWDKAEVISQFFAGVIIAILGFYLTYTIQNTQIQVAKQNSDLQIKSEDLRSKENRRLQQGQLTGQLVEHLTSDSEKVRKIAIVALRESVPKEIYDSVIQIIASNDESQSVRETAIKQLGDSKDDSVSKTLGKIAADENRSENERKIAFEAAGKLSTSTNIPKGTLILTATDTYEHAYEFPQLNGSPFTYYLIKGLKGEADLNKDGIITGMELGQFVTHNVRKLGEKYNKIFNPVFTTYNIGSEIPIIGKSKTYKEVIGLIIGIDDYIDSKMGALRYCVSGANEMYHTIEMFPYPNKNIKIIVNQNATKASILDSLNEMINISSPDSLFIFYFSGHSMIQSSGEVGFFAYDSNHEKHYSTVSMLSIKSMLNDLKSGVKLIFLDTSYSGFFAKLT